jgi:hypothetical protein
MQKFMFFDVAKYERKRVLGLADAYLSRYPTTITAFACPRSAGGKHDFYSEGDYWWPNQENPDLPYVKRDGMSNPANFSEHRRLLVQMSIEVASLTAAWTINGDSRYASHAIKHLVAWFVDERTLMHPSLNYAQAIHGRVTGRGIGIVDTIHFVEVALAIDILTSCSLLPRHLSDQMRSWFSQYLRWLTTHPYGKEEQNERNNHATCWVMQVAAFSKLTGDSELTDLCRARFKSVLISRQMALDGSFPMELARTKPFNYSLFNLEMMAAICQIVSTSKDSLWSFELPDGRGLRMALEFMVPYIRDKRKWPFQHDVMYYDEWPKRHNSLLFGGRAFQMPEYVRLWKTLEPDSLTPEVIRNLFVRQPILWLRSNILDPI